MGVFRYPVDVGASEHGPFERVDAVVDTGATYSQFPRSLLARLGVHPHDRAEFVLADGRTILRDLATVVLRLDGRTRYVLCTVGDNGTEPLIGATTLELFGLTADTVNRRLVRATLYLLLIGCRNA